MPKLKLLCLFAFLLGIRAHTSAQAPPILLQRCYGGDSSDVITCIRQTNDGGYIASGQTLSVNGDLSGNGGITGTWVLKLDASANIQWQKTYPGNFFTAMYIEPTTDGGYILTGFNTMKLHSDGTIDWQKDQRGITIHQLIDGGYILCNGSDTPGIVKLNPDGSVNWQKTYNTSGSSSDPSYTITDVCPSITTGYMITGGYRYDVGGTSMMIGKIDDHGELILTNTLASHGMGAQIRRTFDNNYVVAGYKFSGYYVIAKFDDHCSVLWNKEVPNAAFHAVTTTSDESYVAAGDTANTDVLVKKFDNSGNVAWAETMGGSGYETAVSVIQATDGAYVAAGYTSSNDGDVSGNHGGQDGWVVIFGSNVGVPNIIGAQEDVVIYPTPAMESVNVTLPKTFEDATLKLVNMLGQTLSAKEDINGGSRVIHLSGLPSGEYLLQITSGQDCVSKKIIHY